MGKQTGPRTSHGKKQSSQNSRIHGLLSREVVFSSDDEKSEFTELRNALSSELKPSTPMLEFLFEEILTGMWKCKLALRFELRELGRATAESQNDISDPKEKATAEPIYADTRHALGRKLQLIRELKQEVVGGYVSDRLKEPIIAAFGKRFYGLLQDWKPTNPVLLAMLEMMVTKSETFQGFELPGPKLSSDELKEVTKEQTALEDPLKLQFLAKLLEMEQMHLEQLIEAGQSGATERKQTDPLERFLRYQTTVKRDLYRAIKRYFELKARLGE